MFAPLFFGYGEIIAKQLESMGATVDLFNERPGNSAWSKIMVRYNVRFYHPIIEKYFDRIITENKGKDYDFIFVIKGEAINSSISKKLRQAYPHAKMIVYYWDSLKNIPDGPAKLKLYDHALTFDPVDAKTYGIPLRPLFYHKTYDASASTVTQYQYDFSFIGTAHTIRPRIVKQLSQQYHYHFFSYLFLPHPIVFLYNKLLNRDYRDVHWRDIHFTPIDSKQIRKIYDKSYCILDVEHAKQNGLTMRTIEIVGSQKKLITTNTTIKDYDFYNPNNICIIDRINPQIPTEFMQTPYTPIPSNIQQRYTLESFVKDIFEIEE